jgi:lysophospholipase L1-like esterase
MDVIMKTVLCYGDSNTYGYNPSDGFRYPENVRWTGRLQKLLGDDYRVIEEGCNGRTTVFDDPIEGWKNGLIYLRPCLNSHKPVDIVIMMLGSNDLKESFHASPKDIADGAETLVKDIIDFTGSKQGFVPVIILVAPPEIGEGIATSAFYGHFYENAIERSKQLPGLYKQVAEKNGCVFVNAAEYIKPSKVDSLHLSPEGHAKLAEVLDRVVRESISG